ncbi:hypothetical protein EOD39_10988 [Acipenser ruthenus]|uniref:Uncharacterized protein n=1 Tax=Acipenser ruthenus TaxID=7906 RepID=A0A444TWF0_ACIRT|nr:hypothetical protein EOD39_10988 [Acipenser ruthenus]
MDCNMIAAILEALDQQKDVEEERSQGSGAARRDGTAGQLLPAGAGSNRSNFYDPYPLQQDPTRTRNTLQHRLLTRDPTRPDPL